MIFFKPIKVFWLIVTQTNQTKTKEKVCQSNWKISKNRGILKHIWWEVIREKLMFKMLWNTLKDVLCYLQNESVSMKVFFLNMHKVRLLFNLGKPTHHLIYYAYKIFFYENYWPCLALSSKCRGSISHGDIKVLVFWECKHR